MLKKIKNYFKEKSLKKKEIQKIKVFIINKNIEIVDTFIDLKKPTKAEIKKNC